MARQERFQTAADSVSRRDFVAQTSALTVAALSAGSSIAAESLLEITADSRVDDEVKLTAAIVNPLTIADDTALTYDRLRELGKTYGVKFIKAMQCLNIPAPLGQGLWEGVTLAFEQRIALWSMSKIL
ncbi:MAG: hypothetical protein KDA51_19880 [Planctomycetales bacterium]|nr:hypothetical protein [Planctomycetales bacterium]